jgi:hypothetical protein
MTIARDRHVATRLLDGRILLVGGNAIPGPDPGASADLYDPATGTFSATGSMTTTRFFFTGTRLADGRVLMVGGNGFLGPLASAELYDPATGTFSSTGSMATTRVSQAAALLPDGRVLIAGGQGETRGSSGEPPALASAELYDPATGTFSPTGSMSTARCGLAAALLPDGRVLIVGGSGEIGGSSGEAQDLASAELYEPATGTFSPTGRTASAGPVTATSLRDGRILIAGGYDGPLHWSTTAELYDPATGRFSPTGSMTNARADHMAMLLDDGRVLIADGDASAELYDPATGTFSPTGSMATARGLATATRLADGRVLIAGGLAQGGTKTLASAELYDPRSGTFSPTEP